MRDHYTLTRLYVDAVLASDRSVTLPSAQAHYLMTVLRKDVGASLRLFNGRDGEWQAKITALSRKAVTLHVIENLRAPYTGPDIWLCFALVRKPRTAFILEKATELGVRRLLPVITDRTQYPKLNMDKARAQIIEAAEQTERIDIPEISEPQKLSALLESWKSARRLIFADEAGDGQSAKQVFEGLGGQNAALLIGPEGGFDAKERTQLRSQDYVSPVSLGPRILRSDTAALSLLTLWQAQCGDWCTG